MQIRYDRIRPTATRRPGATQICEEEGSAEKATCRSTQTAYRIDISQFFTWLAENDLTVERPDQVERVHITEYLSYLAEQGRSGVTRARKLAVIREYFLFLVAQNSIPLSPAQSVKMPKKEKKQKNYLRSDEYSKLLAAAGGNPRDFAILQVFLQTGIRVSELIAITSQEKAR